jgi:hypothetical protein
MKLTIAEKKVILVISVTIIMAFIISIWLATGDFETAGRPEPKSPFGMIKETISERIKSFNEKR